MIKKNYVVSLLVAAVIVQVAVRSYSAEATVLEQAKLNIQALIRADSYDQAKTAIDKLKVDFAADKNLPDALYWLAGEYRWVDKYIFVEGKVQWVGKYNEAKQMYQEIVEKYPGSAAANNALLGIARVNVLMLFQQGDTAGAVAAVDEMAKRFAGHPELPETLYWTAIKFEQGKYAEAKKLYEQVLREYPQNAYAEKLPFCIAKMNVLALVEAGEHEQVPAAVEKLIADFNTHTELPHALFMVGEKYFVDRKAPNFQQKAIVILEKVMNDLPRREAVPGMYAEVYCCAGDCYTELKDYTKALGCYEKMVSDYPNYQFAWHAQFMIGSLYQNLKVAGLISREEADAKTRNAYRVLIEKYPDCAAAANAKQWLAVVGSN
jgi:TolA-binding protein